MSDQQKHSSHPTFIHSFSQVCQIFHKIVLKKKNNSVLKVGKGGGGVGDGRRVGASYLHGGLVEFGNLVEDAVEDLERSSGCSHQQHRGRQERGRLHLQEP